MTTEPKCEKPLMPSGGSATYEVKPLSDILGDLHRPLITELHRNLYLEQTAHKHTLAMFQAVLEGRVDPQTIVVNSDGWQRVAERPGPDGSEHRYAELTAEPQRALAAETGHKGQITTITDGGQNSDNGIGNSALKDLAPAS